MDNRAPIWKALAKYRKREEGLFRAMAKLGSERNDTKKLATLIKNLLENQTKSLKAIKVFKRDFEWELKLGRK